MKQNTMRTGREGRKGVAIVEVTIALAVIVLISAAAVSLMMTSVRVEGKFVTQTYTEVSVENVLECFQFAEDEETFYQALQKVDDYQRKEPGRYVFQGKSLKIEVQAQFAPRKLVYTATSNNEIIFTYTFPAEGGEAG